MAGMNPYEVVALNDDPELALDQLVEGMAHVLAAYQNNPTTNAAVRIAEEVNATWWRQVRGAVLAQVDRRVNEIRKEPS